MEEKSNPSDDHNKHGGGGGWQTVSYAKKKLNKKNNPTSRISDSSKTVSNDNIINQNDSKNVFMSLEKHSEDRRRRIEAERAAADENTISSSSKKKSEDDVSSGKSKDSGNAEKKKKQQQKKKDAKKPKVTVPEAARKIDSADLAVFLADTSASYESQEDIQLMRFADYFGRAFSGVGAAQFPWLKLLRESTIENFADIPLCHIPEAVSRTSVDWIDQRSYEALGSFVIWSLNSILADLAVQQVGSRGTKKGSQNASSKSQVAMFLVISMALRKKPDVLINLFPNLRDNSKYHGQDKLLVILWMIVQASQGDLTVGLYLWAHHLLPWLSGKSGSNPQTMDLVLQLVERILSAPNARKILAKGAAKKGERLIPPSALDLFLRNAFPASSARAKTTDRFEAIYPPLIYVALSGSPRSKAMKQLSQQIQPVVMKAAGEAIPDLSEEAAKIFIWCLIQTPECYKHWEKSYTDNVEASVVILRRLVRRWKEQRPKLSALEPLRDTLKSFRQKNEKASTDVDDAARLACFKEADKSCKKLLRKIFYEQYGSMMLILACVFWMALGVGIYLYGLRETY